MLRAGHGSATGVTELAALAAGGGDKVGERSVRGHVVRSVCCAGPHSECRCAPWECGSGRWPGCGWLWLARHRATHRVCCATHPPTIHPHQHPPPSPSTLPHPPPPSRAVYPPASSAPFSSAPPSPSPSSPVPTWAMPPAPSQREATTSAHPSNQHAQSSASAASSVSKLQSCRACQQRKRKVSLSLSSAE